MKKSFLLSLVLASAFPLAAEAEFTQKENQFSGKTVLTVSPDSDWDGQTPTLYLHTEISETSPQSLFFFQVIAPRRYECNTGVTGVLADGKRVISYDEQNDTFAEVPKVTVLDNHNPWLRDYVLLAGRYEREGFQQIAQAREVKYQLCGRDEYVFSLTTQEKSDLKQYAAIAAAEPPPTAISQMSCEQIRQAFANKDVV